MKKLSYLFLTALIALCSCDLEESPITETDKDAVFGSADGLKAYSLSLYDNLPTADGVQQSDVSLTDFFSRTSIDVFIMKGAYNESNATSWSWTALRNINYFIVNCENSSLDKSVIENYLGIGRFFRAYFYFDKVKTYGDVPWIDRRRRTICTSRLSRTRDGKCVERPEICSGTHLAGKGEHLHLRYKVGCLRSGFANCSLRRHLPKISQP